MFDFSYCVDLFILHKSVDAKSISETITEFEVKTETTAGGERLRYNNGIRKTISKKSKITCWSAKLHEEKTINTVDTTLSDFLLQILNKLEKYRQYLEQLREEGKFHFNFGCFCDESAAGMSWDPETIQKCGELGIGIEMTVYSKELPQKL